MIESVLGGTIRIISLLVSSAASLYHLIVAIAVLGGLVILLGTVIHYLWTKSQERFPLIQDVETRRVNVHVQNLNVTIEMSEDHLKAFLDERGSRKLPGGPNDR
jgi:hypothetical protein